MLEIQKRLLAGETPDQICTPLGITFKETNGECIFSYDQILSFKFKNDPVIKECRGLILNTSDWSISAMPFRRFMNYGEDGADELPQDLKDCYVMEKLDGSMLTLRWSAPTNSWKVSTRKMIYAEGPVSDLSDMTFEKLFWEAAKNTHIPKLIEYDILSKGYTYVFELCSTLNRIVTLYPETFIALLMVRNNQTLNESTLDELQNYSELFNCRIPRKYSFENLNTVINSFQESHVDPTFEGYVVLKESSPSHLRVKVKSPKYLAISRLSVAKSTKAFIDLLKLGERDEFLTYYPENTGFIEEIEEGINTLISTVSTEWERIRHITDRKSFAKAVFEQNSRIPALMFQLFDHKITPETLFSHIMAMPTDKIANLLA